MGSKTKHTFTNDVFLSKYMQNYYKKNEEYMSEMEQV